MQRHILVPAGLLLLLLSVRFSGTEDRQANLEHQTACVLFLPEAVNYVNLDQVPYVLVEMRDEKVDIVQVVELPAFCDQGIAEYVS